MLKDNRTLLQEKGIDLSTLRNGKALCPICSKGRRKKNDRCLSVNVSEGKYNCWNDTCDFKGSVSGEYIEKAKKDYVRPAFINTTNLGDELVKWFWKERGISQTTLNRCKLTQSLSRDNKPIINFNYFREGVLVNIKYRMLPKQFRMERDAELILYGLDDIKDSDWCVIVEGEIDKLAFAQCGIMQVVSVPNGASNSKDAVLEYLDNCIDYFENKKKVILATDNDEAGITLRDELARRIGYDVCVKVDMGNYKDANEILIERGEIGLHSLIEEKNLVEYPIDGIITVESKRDKLNYLLENGLKRGYLTKKIPEFDEYVSFEPGQMMVLTGIPNHGKSPFALMVMASLSIEHGWKWALFTPEHLPLELFLVKLCELILGRRMENGNISAEEKDFVIDFMDSHFFFIEPENEDYTLDNIISKAKLLVKRKGIRGLLIDPWNKLEHNIPKGETETNYISRELDKVIRFSKRNLVFSIIVAHPRKVPKKWKSNLHEVPTLYDISSSSNWFNKPDIGISFYRNFETGNSEVYIQKIKYEHLGKQGFCVLRWNKNNSRFNGKNSAYDSTNWIFSGHDVKESATQLEELKTQIGREEDDDDCPF